MARMPHEGARSVGFFLGLLLLADLAIAGGMLVPSFARGRAPAPPAAPPADAAAAASQSVPPEERGWALCQTRFADQDVTPSTVAVTYLDPLLDDAVTAEEVRGWFADLPPRAVEVYKLEEKSGRRRVSFEMSRRTWDDWTEVAGDATGELACAKLRSALRARSVGRPGLKPTEAEASRYDFELLHARRIDRYRTIQLVGTLDRALAEPRFESLKSWLQGP